MTAGPVNRALLESFFQQPGQIYDDTKTESSFDVIADQIDDNYSQVALLINSGVLSPYLANMQAQALINPNFDVWKRVPSGFITNPSLGTFVADRWLISGTPDGGVFPTLTHVRMPIDPITPQGSFYGYRFIADPGGSGFGVNAGYGIYQRIEHGTRFLCGVGKKLTISFYASSSVVGKKIGVTFSQRYGTGGTPTANEQIIGQIITLSTTITKYTITINTNTLSGKTFGTNNDDYFQIGFHYMWGSNEGLSRFNSATTELFQGAEVYLFQVQVNAGDVALPFQPRSLAGELALCQRYYQQRSTNTVSQYDLSPTMRINPTITGSVSPYGYDAEL